MHGIMIGNRKHPAPRISADDNILFITFLLLMIGLSIKSNFITSKSYDFEALSNKKKCIVLAWLDMHDQFIEGINLEDFPLCTRYK